MAAQTPHPEPLDGADASAVTDPLAPEALSSVRLEPGTVALIGGGPGALDLLTVRALALLRQADTVVVDRLGPSAITDLLGEGVEVIAVGKAPGTHSMPQAQIEQTLVERARAGRRVVRLKGGDPFVLGRGGEEILACRAAGVPVTSVPGVTSALAGPAAAGIPVTQRSTAVAVHIVNAHGDLGPADLAAIADAGTTTVLMMGVEWLPRIITQIRLNGIDEATPVAIVQRATHDDQRQVFGTVGTIVPIAEGAKIASPSVIVIGRTAAEGFLDPDTRKDGPGGGAGRDHLPAGQERAPGAKPAIADGARSTARRAAPVLIACAHGTRVRAGRDVIRRIMSEVAEEVDAPVREAYVDVQAPAVTDVVAAHAAPADSTRDRGMPQAVVVPLLLSTGFHVRHDIEGAVAGREAVAAGPLGPDPRLAEVLHERLVQAGWQRGEAVVMAASGSSDPQGIAMVEQMRDLLSARLGTDVWIGYAAAARPRLEDAVAAARADGTTRVAIASYMIAPGRFQQKAEQAGADTVAAPIGDHPLLRQIIIERYQGMIGD